jgi:septal ring factor EnvC (AmiA/AmiB activator)
MTPDDNEPDFDRRDDEDEEIRELRASLLRLQAQIDQTEASIAERRAEMDELRAQVDALERDLRALEALAPRRLRLVAWTERCLWLLIGVFVASLLGLL